MLTSASDHALPPPVEIVFLCRCSTGTLRLDISDDEDDLVGIGFWVGAYDIVNHAQGTGRLSVKADNRGRADYI